MFNRLANAQYFVCCAILALMLKEFYSLASSAQLQWQLYPLVLILQTVSDLSFVATGDFEWWDAHHQIGIVKSCAGVNFLILSFLGYVWLWRELTKSFAMLALALLAGWISALLVNALRIVVCLYHQNALAELLNISEADIHQLIGVTVYFLCLWAQMSGLRLSQLQRNASTSLGFYMAVTVLVPIVRAGLLDLPLPSGGYLLWVLALPIAMVVLLRVWLIIFKFLTIHSFAGQVVAESHHSTIVG